LDDSAVKFVCNAGVKNSAEHRNKIAGMRKDGLRIITELS